MSFRLERTAHHADTRTETMTKKAATEISVAASVSQQYARLKISLAHFALAQHHGADHRDQKQHRS